MEQTNKVALVTGASSGIGLATARLLAQQGIKVALLGRTEKQVKQVMKEFKG